MTFKRTIIFNDERCGFDCSDGVDTMPFGMNGIGGMTVKIEQPSGRIIEYDDISVDRRFLDTDVPYMIETTQRGLHTSTYLKPVLSDLYIDLLLQKDEVGDVPIEDVIRVVELALRTNTLRYIGNGYRFGKELTFDDICITFDSKKIVAYSSHHNGFIAPTILELNKGEEHFDYVYGLIIESICRWLDLETRPL